MGCGLLLELCSGEILTGGPLLYALYGFYNPFKESILVGGCLKELKIGKEYQN